MPRLHRLFLAVLLSTFALACEESGDIGGLQNQLDAAGEGELVLAPAGVYEGGLTVPAGVRLRPEDGAVVKVAGGG